MKSIFCPSEGLVRSSSGGRQACELLIFLRAPTQGLLEPPYVHVTARSFFPSASSAFGSRAFGRRLGGSVGRPPAPTTGFYGVGCAAECRGCGGHGACHPVVGCECAPHWDAAAGCGRCASGWYGARGPVFKAMPAPSTNSSEPVSRDENFAYVCGFGVGSDWPLRVHWPV